MFKTTWINCVWCDGKTDRVRGGRSFITEMLPKNSSFMQDITMGGGGTSSMVCSLFMRQL